MFVFSLVFLSIMFFVVCCGVAFGFSYLYLIFGCLQAFVESLQIFRLVPYCLGKDFVFSLPLVLFLVRSLCGLLACAGYRCCICHFVFGVSK